MFVGWLSYLLSWPVLYDGLQGVDSLWHWHVASWVATEFPGLPYWNRWDLSGVPYRNLYPVLPHWVAIAISKGFGLDTFGGLQLVQFAVTPIMALGLYAFCDWRLKRPLVGVAAALLFLLDPLSWIESVDYMWFASQLGLVLFMPAVIALDWYFELWSSRARGWRPRAAAALFVGLSAAVGAISSAALSAPILVLIAYVLSARRENWRRWLFGPVLLMTLGIVALQLFWMGPFFGFLSFVGSRAPALVFNPALVTTFDIHKLLELVPINANLDADRYSISPAVWLPAAGGLVYALRDGRARVPAALSLLGLALLTFKWLYYPLAVVPTGAIFVEAVYRPAAIHLRFFVPLLAGLGLFALPGAVVTWLGKRQRWPALALLPAKAAALALAAVILVADVVGFAGHIVALPYSLAYGPGFEGTYYVHGPDIRDLWHAHTDQCRTNVLPFTACSSATLTDAFSVSELATACAGSDGSPRKAVPICIALGPDLKQPAWDPANDSLVAATEAWCVNRADPVCTAGYAPLWRQLLDPGLWRAPMVGCYLAWCQAQAAGRATWPSKFASTPQRLEAQGEVQALAAAAHELTGGASASTIAVGGGGAAEPSRDLYQFVENSLLKQPGVDVKRQLTAITGIDAVALGAGQVGQSADYRAMGWTQTSNQPVVYQDPSPSSLATEWPAGNAALVVGASQTDAAEVYNSIFERSATGGLVPFARGWLVRGPTPYVDDYSPADLSRYGTIILVGYRYHSHDSAWGRLAQWVQAGGRLFVETGWQYVDPDWAGGGTPSVLPVSSAKWGPLDGSAQVLVGSGSSAQIDPGFGAFRYQAGEWGASSAPESALRSGAEAVVTVGGRIVVARETFGSGRVLWSGANLLAHASQAGSASENMLIRDQFSWLLPDPAPGATCTSPSASVSLAQNWSGNELVSIPLAPSAGPALVLFKESQFPGWSAEVVSADGSRRPVSILDSEYDYMLVPLDSVAAGAKLEFRYRPPVVEVGFWVISALSLLVILAWLVFPRWVPMAGDWTRSAARKAWSPVRARVAAGWADDDG